MIRRLIPDAARARTKHDRKPPSTRLDTIDAGATDMTLQQELAAAQASVRRTIRETIRELLTDDALTDLVRAWAKRVGTKKGRRGLRIVKKIVAAIPRPRAAELCAEIDRLLAEHEAIDKGRK